MQSGLSNSRRSALIVGLIAAAVRIVWVAIASRSPVGLADPIIYLDSAASIAAGDGYTSLLGRPTAYYPPGYPFFVGALDWATDLIGQGSHLVLAIGLVQALLGGVAAAALVIAGDLLVDHLPGVDSTRRVSLGVVAGLLFAFWPNLIIHTALVLSESLFLAAFCILLASLFTWCTAQGRPRTSPTTASRPRWSVGLVVVVSTAACTLVRPQSVLLLAPAAALTWLICGAGWRATLRGAALLVVGLMVAVVPWTIRNAVVMHAFVPMSTNTGDNLCIGFHDGATGSFVITDACATQGRYVDGPRVEVARDAELRSRTLHWIADHPGALPRLSIDKLTATFGEDTDGLGAWESYGADRHLSDTQRSVITAVSNLYYWCVAALSLAGAALVLRKLWTSRRTGQVASGTRNAVLAVAVALTGLIMPVLFFGDARFKIAIVPCLALLAAVTVDRVAGLRSATAS